MAQGKLKVKTKCPPSIKQKKKQKKGSAISKRSNCPMKSKKKNSEANKFKKMVTKTVNKAVEEEIRNRALPSQKLSKIQEAIAKHNKS